MLYKMYSTLPILLCHPPACFPFIISPMAQPIPVRKQHLQALRCLSGPTGHFLQDACLCGACCPNPGLAKGADGCYQWLRRSGYFPWASRSLHFTERTLYWVKNPILNPCDHDGPITLKQLIPDRLKPTKISVCQSQRLATHIKTLSQYEARRLFGQHRTTGKRTSVFWRACFHQIIEA